MNDLWFFQALEDDFDENKDLKPLKSSQKHAKPATSAFSKRCRTVWESVSTSITNVVTSNRVYQAIYEEYCIEKDIELHVPARRVSYISETSNKGTLADSGSADGSASLFSEGERAGESRSRPRAFRLESECISLNGFYFPEETAFYQGHDSDALIAGEALLATVIGRLNAYEELYTAYIRYREEATGCLMECPICSRTLAIPEGGAKSEVDINFLNIEAETRSAICRSKAFKRRSRFLFKFLKNNSQLSKHNEKQTLKNACQRVLKLHFCNRLGRTVLERQAMMKRELELAQCSLYSSFIKKATKTRCCTLCNGSLHGVLLERCLASLNVLRDDHFEALPEHCDNKRKGYAFVPTADYAHCVDL